MTMLPAKQTPRQFGEVGGDAPCLVAGEELRRRASARGNPSTGDRGRRGHFDQVWVEFEPLSCNISSMAPLEKCLQTLRVLIDVGDVQAIERAERAIDEYVASQDGPDRQTEALNVLDQEVTSLAQDKPDRSFEFVETILGYIDERVQGLRKGE